MTALVNPTRGQMTDDQVNLVKRQICKPKNRDATDDELAMFIGQCERTGLDPFARQIYAVFRFDRRANDEKMMIQASIDGLRLVAERTGKYVGQDGPFWCGPNGLWSDTWMNASSPSAARAVVKKVIGGVVAETPAVAHYREYAPSNPTGTLWPSKPALMIAKCAEALALRKAFPQELSGLYTAEEMSQAETEGPLRELPASTSGPNGMLASPAQKKRLRADITRNSLNAEVMTALLKGVSFELEEGEKINDALNRLTSAQCSSLIDEISKGTIKTGASDVPPPAVDDFKHPPVEPEADDPLGSPEAAS